MNLAWPDSVGATSYNLYRFAGSSLPALFNPKTDATKISSVTSPHTDSPLAGGFYFYWVTAVGVGGESAATAGTGDPKNVNPCQANLNGSSKTVFQVNGVAYNPATTSLKLGDKVTFKIILDNTQGATEAATNISIVDTFTNLKIPAGGLNANYSGTPIPQGSGSGTWQILSGTEPNQTLWFNLTGPAFNVPAGAVRTLTFTAEIGVPTGFNGSFSRTQNSAVINYSNGAVPTKNVSTPLLIFTVGGGSPTIIEVP
jgi:hypothetical protein